MRAPWLLVAVAACAGPSPRPNTSPPPPGAPTDEVEPVTAASYRAQIRWTGHGVPHIVAADLGGLAFGQGYAQARARLCEIADGIVRVRGERARYFGRGAADDHVRSDLVHLHLGYVERARALVPTASAETRAMLAGFAAGYSHAVASIPVAERPAACRDGAWLGPITDVDVAAYALSIQSLASARYLRDAIADAAPTATGAPLPPPDPPGGSNAWSIGGDRTASGGGILIGNPHFPWQGDLVFHEAHLTIPGDLDVYGAALAGTPGIQIGATPHHAWTHTFSKATHMVLYRVELAPGSALRYRHGDDTVAITAHTYAIAVRQADGTIASERVTRYRSAVGPMIVTPEAAWDGPGGFAFTLRDVAAGSTVALDQYLAMARARSRDAFEAALALHGTPFVNTVYADASGDALYVDGSRVPDLEPDALARWQLTRKLVPAVEAAWRQRLVILDGSDPVNDLVSDDPQAPGAIPLARAPRVVRRDFVMNANDSFRFTNLDAPETTAKHSPLWGDDDGQPSLRTLANLAALDAGAGGAGDDGRFTLDETIAALLGHHSFTAARLRDDILPGCPSAPMRRPRPTTPIFRACDTLRAWDGRFAIDSRGAALWRAVMARLAPDGTPPWQRGFDRQAPRLTPDGLTVDRAAITAALVAAVGDLQTEGHAADVALGELQRAAGPHGPAPVPGGSDDDGVVSIAARLPFDATLLPPPTVAARAPVDFGSSFILAAEYTATGRAVRALLTYGNSSDPRSPHFRDQLSDLAAGRLRTVPLTDAEITADPAYRLEEIHTP